MKTNHIAEPRGSDYTNKTELPQLIFGTSGLGNLYVSLSYEEKLEIVRQCFLHSKGKVVFTTRPEKIKSNIEMTEKKIPSEFWLYLKANHIIKEYYHADTYL